MPYSIEFKPSAACDFAKLPRKDRIRIVGKIEALAEEPRPSQSRKLRGVKDLYRIRAGNYRILYQARDRNLLVLVVRIADRGSVYRENLAKWMKDR